jgi:HEAT repeat protein
MLSFARRTLRVRLLAVLMGGAVVLAAARSVRADALFDTIDASTLIVWGTVEGQTPYDAAKLRVFRIQVERVVKGEAAAGEAIDLAQEILFPTTQPYFATGTRTLILAIPLPGHSSYRKALPEGRYWRWTARLDVATDVARYADPAMTEVVAGYLAVRHDPEATASFLIGVITGPDARVREDALAAIERRPELAALLDPDRLRTLEPWFASTAPGALAQAQVLVRLARAKAPGIATIAERQLDRGGPLQAAAVDALVSLDRVPAEARLLAWSAGSDEALRIAASRGLAKIGSPVAVDRLAALLRDDRSTNVATAVLRALGDTSSPKAVEILGQQLRGSDEARVTIAAESLAKIGTSEAIAKLGAALEGGNGDAQAAAAFALKRARTPEAEEILHYQEKNHPDPQVRKLCRIALGEDKHEH